MASSKLLFGGRQFAGGEFAPSLFRGVGSVAPPPPPPAVVPLAIPGGSFGRTLTGRACRRDDNARGYGRDQTGRTFGGGGNLSS